MKGLLADKSDISYRATWLMSLIYIDKGQLKEAKDTISNNPQLFKDVLGKETLARIALIEGNNDRAYEIYSSIEKDSSEAKSYLAKKAFSEKDWKKARELTESLIQEYPNNLMIRANLEKIIEAEAKAQSYQNDKR